MPLSDLANLTWLALAAAALLIVVFARLFRKKNPQINQMKLLDFDVVEREKNQHVLKNYVIEKLWNVRVLIESMEEESKQAETPVDLGLLKGYVEKTIKDITLLVRLLGAVKLPSAELKENLLSVFKAYGQSHRVSMRFKIRGRERKLKQIVEVLMVGITSDLMYIIVQQHSSVSMEAFLNYRHKQLMLILKYKDGGSWRLAEGDLSYCILRSIENRLSLVGGQLRVKTKLKTGKATCLIQMPLDQTTCQEL